MNVARPDDGAPGEPAAADGGRDREAPGPVHGLFQRRFAGDDALGPSGSSLLTGIFRRST
jgi:hypothetical protein